MPPVKTVELARERTILSMIVTMGAVFGLFFPPLLFLAAFPLTIMIYRHGLKAGILSSVLAGLVVGVLAGAMGMLVVFLALGIGVAQGEALRDKLSLGHIVGAGWVIALLVFVVPFFAAQYMLDVNLLQETFQYWEESAERVLLWSGADQAGITAESVRQLALDIQRMLPAMVALSAAFISILNYWLAGRWLRRLGTKVPWFPRFSLWRFPWYLAWIYITGAGLPLLEALVASDTILAIALNAQMLAGSIFMLQGLAIIWYFVEEKRARVPIKIAVVLSLMLPFVPQILILVGVLDTWFDFRRLERR